MKRTTTKWAEDKEMVVRTIELEAKGLMEKFVLAEWDELSPVERIALYCLVQITEDNA